MDRTASFYSHPTYVQRGAGLPVYSGSRRQRGGSVFGALKSFIMPFLGTMKNTAINRAKTEAFGMAKDVALDAFRGRNLGQSLKTRGLQHAKRLGKHMLTDTTSAITAPVSRKRKALKKKFKRPLKKRRINNF